MEDAHVVDALLQYAGSDKLDRDGWATLVMSTRNVDNADLELVLKNAEDAFKERTKLTALPTKWRTAKSVLLKARRAGMSMIDENGEVVGKSAAEKYVKERITPDPTTVPKNSWELAGAAMSHVNAALSAASTTMDRDAIKAWFIAEITNA